MYPLSGEDNQSVPIVIPKKLFERINKKIKNTQFSSVSEYVTSIIETELNTGEEDEVFSKEDEEAIKKRLRSLGYL